MGRRTIAVMAAGSAAVFALAAAPGHPAKTKLLAVDDGDTVTLASAQTATAGSTAVTMADVATISGAGAYRTAGITGAGVDVAVIDSGVTPVPGLNATGKVVYGPDFSTDAGVAAIENLDLVGHGTHMAGIIASTNAAKGYSGMAPDARIVSVKVAGPDGTTDAPRVLQAIDWVIDNKDSGGLHIRVLNLSLGQI